MFLKKWLLFFNQIDSGFVGNDDEAAERVMELCAESGVLAPLRSALLSKISMAARSVHILQWTKVRGKKKRSGF